jgi:hypothetical protein
LEFFKDFIKQVCHDDRYYAVIEEHMAEFFMKGEMVPICLIEYEEDSDKYMVNMRMGVHPHIVADLMYRMTVADSDIIISEDFILHNERGYIFGEEARSLYFMSIYTMVDDAVEKQNLGVEGATFVVKEPLPVFEGKRDFSSKIKKLWLDEEF